MSGPGSKRAVTKILKLKTFEKWYNNQIRLINIILAHGALYTGIVPQR
jgi:hypothetical protein